MRKIISEELSVSMEVQETCNNVIEEIVARLKDKQPTEIVGKDVSCAWFTLHCKMLSVNANFNGENIIVDSKVYSFENEEMFDNLWQFCNFGGSYEISTQHIELSCYEIGGKFDKAFASSILSHELEHALQHIQSNNSIVGNSYNKAKMIVQGKDFYHVSELFNNIAQVIYFYHPREIDANVNGAYNELLRITEKNNIKGKKVLGLLPFAIAIREKATTDDCLSEIDVTKSIVELNYFGFSPRSFESYVAKYQAYFNRKLRKVVQKLINDTLVEAIIIPWKNKLLKERKRFLLDK